MTEHDFLPEGILLPKPLPESLHVLRSLGPLGIVVLAGAAQPKGWLRARTTHRCLAALAARGAAADAVHPERARVGQGSLRQAGALLAARVGPLFFRPLPAATAAAPAVSATQGAEFAEEDGPPSEL